MKYSTLAEAQAATPRDRIPEDGNTTCLWHRQHEHCMAHIVPLLPRCDICGGEVESEQERHELCRARLRCGVPTPRLSVVRTCPCAKCRKEAAS